MSLDDYARVPLMFGPSPVHPLLGGAVHVRIVSGQVVATTALATTFREPIGLGIVYRAEAIAACVDVLLERAQLTRKASQPVLSADQSETPADAALDEAAEADKPQVSGG